MPDMKGIWIGNRNGVKNPEGFLYNVPKKA